MSFLLAKSDKNLEAAKLLNEKTYYASSVHCSYYSCIQIIKHILINKFGETDTSLYVKAKSDQDGAHEVLINLCVEHLKAMRKDFRTFNNDINQLKTIRIDADYRDIDIVADKSREVYRKAREIVTQLKGNFAI